MLQILLPAALCPDPLGDCISSPRPSLAAKGDLLITLTLTRWGPTYKAGRETEGREEKVDGKGGEENPSRESR